MSVLVVPVVNGMVWWVGFVNWEPQFSSSVIPVDLWLCSNCSVSVFLFLVLEKLTLLWEDTAPGYPTQPSRGGVHAGCVNASPQVVSDMTSARRNHDHCMASSSPSHWCLHLRATTTSVQELCMPQAAVMVMAAQQGDSCSATITLQIEITAGWGQKYPNKVCNKANSGTWNGRKKNTSINLTPPSLIILLSWKWTTPTENLVSPQHCHSAIFIIYLAWSLCNWAAVILPQKNQQKL